MIILLGILFFVKTEAAFEQSESCELKLGGSTCPIVSQDYPARSPPNTEQLWQQRVPSPSQYNVVLRLYCSDFRIPSGAWGKCEESALEIEEAGKVERFCGTEKFFHWTTSTASVDFRLIQGRRSGYLNCQTEAILVDSNGVEVITSTTPPPPPDFLSWVSEEIDSDEHGVVPGLRSTTCICGWTNKVVSRIVNGTETGINEYPFVAALVVKRTTGHICGATIITKRHAISASHCTYGYRDGELSILVGEHNLDVDNETPYTRKIDVQRIVNHPNFIKSNLKNDITILDLAEEIQFHKFVGPVCMLNYPLNLEAQYVKILGWGDVKWQGPSSRILHKADVRVIPLDQCRSIFTSMIHQENNQLCTFAKKKGACQGDSGGPVIWLDPETNRYTLVGDSSFNNKCNSDVPSVHASVSHYLTWINQHVEASGLALCTKR